MRLVKVVIPLKEGPSMDCSSRFGIAAQSRSVFCNGFTLRLEPLVEMRCFCISIMILSSVASRSVSAKWKSAFLAEVSLSKVQLMLDGS